MNIIGYILKAIEELNKKNIPATLNNIMTVIYMAISDEEKKEYFRPETTNEVG